MQARSRLVAGLLGIFLGGFGVHRFYLGYSKIGILQIVVTILTLGVGSLWGFIEGIIIIANAGFPTDAEGVPLTN
ncbi:TM2 domain-containing protein [Arcanobacterium bovis]|uniref:TM2 domain-containing protein n=2 Tax=Arcanobacterium bovis TaxID=2529275 RepID=A0A4Q9UZ23_9ACTO|nr:TM2 domain-containing protein [Arcanobacterium bovis]